MFKDYDKYLSASLKVYLFVLVCVLILKLVGLDYFGLDVSNPTVIVIDKFILRYKLINLWYFFTYYVYVKVIVSISLNQKLDKKLCFPISLLSLAMLLFVKPHLTQTGIVLFDYFYLLIINLSINKFKDIKGILKRYTIMVILNIVFQGISLFIRNINSEQIYFENSILWILINLDYIMLSIISYRVYFMEGVCQKWVEVFSSLLKKINLKNLLKALQRNLHNFKKKSKQERLAISIYIFFSLLWNIFSLVVILLVANLNHTFVECIFILTSFWLSKRIFGKAFHLSSMAQCFAVSNLTYYCLNRITTPLGISILVPIMLGVGLSYVTSKLVKKLYKPLYRGMPKDLFEETILQVVDKDSDKYKICYEYFVDKKSAIYLSMKYVYSEAGIRKIKDRVNKQIEKLN